RAYRGFGGTIGLEDITCLPISAVHGDNVVRRSDAMPWYRGPTLLEHLEAVPVGEDLAARPFRMPVPWVNRPSPDVRGFAGVVWSGSVRVGETVRILPSGRQSTVARILVGAVDGLVASTG